jgi:hypothetical protein
MRLLPVVCLPLLVAGCGGINASHTVSPLDFFLPGGTGFLRHGLIKADPPRTNEFNFPPQNSLQIAVAR